MNPGNAMSRRFPTPHSEPRGRVTLHFFIDKMMQVMLQGCPVPVACLTKRARNRQS